MYIIAGLGNPGKKYENTRHNLGFITLDLIAKKNNVKIEKSKFKALTGECIIKGEKVILLKPQTYMNNSGEAIREALDFYKLEESNLMVIYDDVDIPLGKIRIRNGGSGGTHNGMKSIISHLGSNGFPRIRIGIGREHVEPLMDYVLGGFTKDEVKPLEDACTQASVAALCYVEDGIDMAMNRYNIKDVKE